MGPGSFATVMERGGRTGLHGWPADFTKNISAAKDETFAEASKEGYSLEVFGEKKKKKKKRKKKKKKKKKKALRHWEMRQARA